MDPTTNQLAPCFQTNYYESDSFAKFIEDITQTSVSKTTVAGKELNCLGDTCLSIAPYPDPVFEQAMQQNIHLSRIRFSDNRTNEQSSVMEYSVMPTASYQTLFMGYHKRFRSQVRQARKQAFSFHICRTEKELHNLGLTLNDIYQLYAQQMKRLWSFQFPFSYFTSWFSLKEAVLVCVTLNKKLVAYAALFENEENVYISLAGADFRYAQQRPANFLYDEIIHYAADQQKHIHCGLGLRTSGGNRFKKNAGFIQCPIEQFPDHQKMIERYEQIAMLPGIRRVNRFIFKHWSLRFSRSFYKTIIPFT